MTKIISLLLILASLVSVTPVSAGEIDWLNSLDKGLETAKQQKKPVMIDFYTDWCGWCKKLDKDTYNNPKVQQLAEKFVSVKVDGDKDTANTLKYGIDGYPTIVFLDSSGNEIDRNIGYAGPEELAKMMEGALTRIIHTMNNPPTGCQRQVNPPLALCRRKSGGKVDYSQEV